MRAISSCTCRRSRYVKRFKHPIEVFPAKGFHYSNPGHRSTKDYKIQYPLVLGIAIRCCYQLYCRLAFVGNFKERVAKWEGKYLGSELFFGPHGVQRPFRSGNGKCNHSAGQVISICLTDRPSDSRVGQTFGTWGGLWPPAGCRAHCRCLITRMSGLATTARHSLTTLISVHWASPRVGLVSKRKSVTVIPGR